jgi:hypothetical protein
MTHHRGATSGWLIALLVVLGLLYVGWRSGALRRIGADVGRMRPGRELRGLRIRPITLLPSLALLIVVLVLVIEH